MSQLKHAAGAALKNIWPHGLRITETIGSNSQIHARRSTPTLEARCLSIYKSLVAAWRWLEGRRSLQLSSRRLRVTETLSLGEKRNLLIVTVDGAQLLIGTSVAGVQLLTKLEASGHQASGQGKEWGS